MGRMKSNFYNSSVNEIKKEEEIKPEIKQEAKTDNKYNSKDYYFKEINKSLKYYHAFRSDKQLGSGYIQFDDLPIGAVEFQGMNGSVPVLKELK